MPVQVGSVAPSAPMVELQDTLDSKSSTERCNGWNPFRSTKTDKTILCDVVSIPI